MKTKDLAGQKFGRLTAIERIPGCNAKEGVKRRQPRWICICECGNRTKVGTSKLTTGKTKSCGCSLKEGMPWMTELSIKVTVLPDGISAFNRLYNNYKQNSKKRTNKVSFMLTKDEFKKIVQSNCYYCGAPPKQIYKSYRKHSDSFVYNGIDRVDNKRGYDIDNSVAACHICNRAKSDLTLDEFLEWKEKFSSHKVLK